ncbi:MAG TPA: sulfite oxidase [Gemmatimonadales bacterium]|nr:sulfite oxidase [Gemmatimonadales bacterium]
MRSQRLMHGSDGLNSGVWPVPTDSLITSTEDFFTRSHAPIPSIDVRTWRLEVGGLVERPRQFSMAELIGEFPAHEVTATVACAGLRRAELLSLGPLPGELPWGPEPISTAHWTGFSLATVLQAVGVSSRARHVEFVGLDRVERQGRSTGFGGSIDMAKALQGDVLLAVAMNGAPLTPHHGYPLRALVPGWIGARSVKWLGQINLLEVPSENYFQVQAYRSQREVTRDNPRDVSQGLALTSIPVNSVIVDPAPHAVLRTGSQRLRGWAIGSSGEIVRTVEISSDGGNSWSPATITVAGGKWAWSFWEAEVTLPAGNYELAARATDTRGTTQPATLGETWNVKGYNNNAWHRVPVTVK